MRGARAGAAVLARAARAAGGRTLDRYVASRFAAIYAATLASFTLIYVLVDTVAQVSGFLDKAEGNFGAFLGIWFRFYAAQVPILFCRVLGPVTAAAGACFTVTVFQRANEFVPVLSAGVSLRRLVAPILVLTGLAVAGSACLQEIWIPARRDAIREARAVGRGPTKIRHLKYFDAKRGVLVAIKRYNPKKLTGEGIEILSPPGRGERSFLIEARSMSWVDGKGRRGHSEGQWVLEDGKIQEYDAAGNLIPPARPAPAGPAAPPSGDPAAGRLFLPFDRKPLADLTAIKMLPEQLEEHENQDSFLRFGEIQREVRQRRAEGAPDLFRWQIRLYARIVDPLHTMILVVLGIPIILARGSRNIFLTAISITAVSALYFIAYVLLLNAGNRGIVSPALATGLAPIMFGALGITLFAKTPS